MCDLERLRVHAALNFDSQYVCMTFHTSDCSITKIIIIGPAHYIITRSFPFHTKLLQDITQQRQVMPSDEQEFRDGARTPLLHLGSLSMTEMVRLMFEPCSLCSDIDHLIHEVEFHTIYILSTPWSPAATKTEGGLPPAVQGAMDAYKRGELSTESEEEEAPTTPGVQDWELSTYRDYLEDQNHIGRLQDTLQTLAGYQPDPSQAESQTVHSCQEWLGVPKAIPIDLENGFSTCYAAETMLTPDNEEQGVVGWRSRIRGFTRVSPGIKRRMGRILG